MIYLKNTIKTLGAAALALLSLGALAQVQVGAPWVRATVAQQKATGAFMQLTTPKSLRLVEVRTPAAGVVEIHQMEMVDNVMRMREVSGGLELPAGKTVELKPGGYHLMLLDLKKPVKDGDKIALTLVLEGEGKRRETVEVTALARPIGSSGH